MKAILNHVEEPPLVWSQSPARFFEFVETVCLFDEVIVLQGWDELQITTSSLEQAMISAFNDENYTFFSLFDNLLNSCKSTGVVSVMGPKRLANIGNGRIERLMLDVREGPKDGGDRIMWAASMILDATPVITDGNPGTLNAIAKKRHEWHLLLQNVYAKLSDKLHALVTEYDRSCSTFVPPLPAHLLRKVNSVEEIPGVLFELREKCKPLRQVFAEFEATMRDRAVPLKEKERLGVRLNELGLAVTGKKSLVGVSCYPWRDLREFVAGVVELAGDELKDEKLQPTRLLKVLAGLPIEMIVNHLKFRRFSYLFQLGHEYRSRGSDFDVKFHAIMQKHRNKIGL